jgi:hypothetical protein
MVKVLVVAVLRKLHDPVNESAPRKVQGALGVAT